MRTLIMIALNYNKKELIIERTNTFYRNFADALVLAFSE